LKIGQYLMKLTRRKKAVQNQGCPFFWTTLYTWILSAGTHRVPTVTLLPMGPSAYLARAGVKSQSAPWCQQNCNDVT